MALTWKLQESGTIIAPEPKLSFVQHELQCRSSLAYTVQTYQESIRREVALPVIREQPKPDQERTSNRLSIRVYSCCCSRLAAADLRRAEQHRQDKAEPKVRQASAEKGVK